MSQSLVRPVVPSFETIEGLCDGLAQKGQGTGIDLYPRDGTRLLSETEAQAAALADVAPDNCLAYNSGMTALSDAVDVAIESSESTSPTIGVAQQLYGKATCNLRRYANRHGLKLVNFDSGSTDAIERMLDRHQPDVIISETVSNGPDTPVLNHEYLINLTQDSQSQATVILDHTLPLSSGYRLWEDIKEEDKVMVVESGTKAYTLNRELLGLTFTKNTELLETLRSLRCDRGSLPGVGSLERISAVLPETKSDFDSRNRQIYANTGILALSLYEASKEPGADFIVSHPCLPDHDNHEYAKRKNGGDISPIFYLQCLKTTQKELAKRFERHPEVVEQSEFSQSFGFNEARILPDAQAPVVRIAGGADTNARELGAALSEAVLDTR